MRDNIDRYIDNQLTVIQSSLEWADKYDKDSFSRKEFKEYRRQTKKIKYALQSRCSIAAYGESQVGKSYLMSSLLSSSAVPFVIVNGRNEYSFIDEINPSGGNTTKIESTGVITRFTAENKNPKMSEYVRVQNLSVEDIIMLILDSYYNDLKINPKSSLSSNDINNKLQELQTIWSAKTIRQTYIEEDNVRDIQDYISDIIGNEASNVWHSNFFDVIAQNIQNIPVEKWVDVFGLMWNQNSHMSNLFNSLIMEYKKIKFNTEVYIPFSAVLRKNGTLLKIQWLDLMCGEKGKSEDFPVLTTDVYDGDGQIIVRDFSKAFLSACTAEITIVLPMAITMERKFLNNIDLLDFPGARSRERISESEIATVLPKILRRGKVAYLFNKYSRSRMISSILFCHHNDQKTEPTIGEAINNWIEDVIGKSPKERAERLRATDNVSPLFMVATKFNIDLSMQKVDRPGELTNHWRRFSEVIPEIIEPYQWLDNWSEASGIYQKIYFQNIFPLRDFYWSGSSRSGMSNLFEGYSDRSNDDKSEETGYREQAGYPDYFKDLHDSFITNKFVQDHFANPEQAWHDVATPKNDGSNAIIRAIDKIATHLDSARENTYIEELKGIKEHISKALEVYYEPEDDNAKSQKTKLVTGRIRARLFMSVGANPEIFGRIIDSLMIEPEDFRKIARDIIVLKTDTPKDFSTVNFLRANAGLNPADGKDINMQKLLDFFGMSNKEELEEEFVDKEYSIDDVIAGEQEFCSTVADVITKHVIEHWTEHINNSVASLEKYLPFTEDVTLALKTLVNMLGVKKVLSEKISRYDKMFATNERLNAIADYASLELNSFISTVGRRYMTEVHIQEIKEKSNRCGIDVDLSSQGIEASRKKQSLVDVLNALDSSTDIMKQIGFNASDMQTLRRLPLWDNFQRWQNLLLIGMILASGVSTKDPKANAAVKGLIDQTNFLYI